MLFFQILRDHSKESMINENEKINSTLFYGQKYLETDEIFRLNKGNMYKCVRPLYEERFLKKENLADQRYYVRYIEKNELKDKAEMKEWLLSIIHNPVGHFFWPSDVIMAHEGAEDRYAWVIPYTPDSNNKLIKLSDFLEQQDILNLSDEEIKNLNKKRMRIATDILHAAKAFFVDAGMRYCNWRADHIYMAKNGKLYVNFTDHINTFKESYDFDKSFADWTLYYSPREENYSNDGDYFSLMILLFYVFVGRFPYDGRMMGEMSFQTEAEQMFWNAEYRKRAVFIFDKGNNENAIGTFAHEKKYVAAWNELSEELCGLFTAVFDESNPLNAQSAFHSIYKMLIAGGSEL